MLYPAELRDRWSRYKRIGCGGGKSGNFSRFIYGKKSSAFLRNFKDLRALAVLGNRCSIRLSYGTVREISLSQWLLAFLPIWATAHVTRTSKVVPVQIPVQNRRAAA